MYLKLYDYNESLTQGKVKLHWLETFNDRVEYIEENVLNVDRYRVYYKECPSRWLGIKIVNRPAKMENVKFTLDYIAGYLLNTKEYSVHSKKKRYLELLEKSTSDNFDNELQHELDELKDNILYRRPSKSFKITKNFILMENKKYEQYLRDCLMRYEDNLETDNELNYQDTYCLNKTTDQMVRINYIKVRVKEIVSLLNVLNEMKKKIKNEISYTYSKLKESKSELVNIIASSKQLKKINEDVRYYRMLIEELSDEYLWLTENKTK